MTSRLVVNNIENDTGVTTVRLNPSYQAFELNSAERLRIDSAGDVGINQNNPTAKLHIVEATSTTAVKIKSGTNSNQNTHITLYNDNDVPLNLGVFGSAASTVGTIAANTAFMTSNSVGGLAINASNASGIIKFGTGSSEIERLRITSAGQVNATGNVGVQTTTVEGTDLVGAGTSFFGAYIGDGMLAFHNRLDNSTGYYVAPHVNALNAGPITLGSTMTLDGTWVII